MLPKTQADLIASLGLQPTQQDPFAYTPQRPQSIIEPLPFDYRMGFKNPTIRKLQNLGDFAKSLFAIETPLDAVLSGVAPPAKAATGVAGLAKNVIPNFDKFKKLTNKGKLQKAKSKKESLKSILEKKVPAQDFYFDDYDELYESGVFTNNLEKAGLYVIDDMMGKVIAGKTKKDALRLAQAKNPTDYGKSYGYSDADIAKFYLEKNKGNYKNAYKEYIEDF